MTFPPLPVETIATIVGAAGSAFMAAGMTVWKISRWITQSEAEAERRNKVLSDLVAKVEEMSRLQGKLSHAVSEQRLDLRQREKDTIKLEGKVEQSQQTMVTIIANLQQATGSLNAMWQTLQTLFPDRVPKRASDRG